MAFVALVVHAQRSRTKTRRAWSLLAFPALCNVVLLASARANVVGPDIAREYRYQTETAALFVLAVGLAFLPVLDAPEQNAVREAAEPENPRVVAAITAAVVAAALLSSTRYVDLWQHNNPSEQYFANVDRTLAAEPTTSRCRWSTSASRRRCCGPTATPRTPTPTSSRTSTTRRPIPGRRWTGCTCSTTRVTLSPVAIPPARSQLGGSGCGFPLVDDTTTIPLDGPVIGGGWWLRISYASPEAVDLHLVAGEEEHDLSLPEGLHNVFVQANGEFDRVAFDNYPARTGLCVTALTLGLPVPTPPAS